MITLETDLATTQENADRCDVYLPHHDPFAFSMTIDEDVQNFLRNALEEDNGPGDITTLATISSDKTGLAKVIVKETGILSGSQVFMEVFNLLNDQIRIRCWAKDGQLIPKGTTIFTLQGPLTSILTGERTALNMLGIMSGIATVTSHHVKAVSHTKAKITDTRKTTPLLRRFEKYAVRTGGGTNHRMGLYDMIIIKDNHIDSCGGIEHAVNTVRKQFGHTYMVIVETRDLDEVREAVQAGADRIMLDNMNYETMREAVMIIGGRADTEASGGVNLQTVALVAETGVDYISIGALTHSYKCLDFSLLIEDGN